MVSTLAQTGARRGSAGTRPRKSIYPLGFVLVAFVLMGIAGAAIGAEALETQTCAGCVVCEPIHAGVLPRPQRSSASFHSSAARPFARAIAFPLDSDPRHAVPCPRGEYGSWNGTGTPLR